MMEAFAAEIGAAAEHAEAFYHAPEFWVAVSFVILMILVAKPVAQKVAAALDERSDGIKNQIDEARRLRDEAQELLASFQRKQRDAVKETDEIVEYAKQEVERMTERTTSELERALKRREELSLERIAQAEAKALEEIRNLAIDVALEATRRILGEQVKGVKSDALVDDSINELTDRLN